MQTVPYLTLAAYVAGLMATLVLAAFLTPARWWQRPNLRAVAVLAGGTWGIGSLLLGLVQGPAMAHGLSAAPVPGRMAAPAAPLSFRVHEDLNLRAAKGTAAARIGVVPAGTVVTTTGLRDGDWWQVRAHVGGRELQGWSSSLWLRRADE